MKTKFISFLFLLSLLLSCSNDMSKEKRIKNYNALKEIKNIALISFAIRTSCLIDPGNEEPGYIKDFQEIKDFGRFHLACLYDSIKANKSLAFFDLNKLYSSENYQNLKLENTYVTNRKEWLPHWLSPGEEFTNVYKGVGIIKLNSDNSKSFCKALNADDILSIEITYSLDDGFNLPLLGNFIKPKWSASCNVSSELYNSKGELIWHYEFKVDSPLEVKANKSMNLILYWTSSITGKQTNELIESVAKYSSQKLINTLGEDINAAIN